MTTTKQYFKVKNGLEFPIQDALTVTDNGGPSVRPSLTFDFANSEKLDSRLTHVRGTSATYFDGTKVKAEENLFAYSSDFSVSWGLAALTQTNAAATAPDGTFTAVKFTNNSTNDTHYVGQSISIPLSMYVNTPVTFSVYLRYIDNPYVSVSVSGAGDCSFYAIFDLKNGTVSEQNTQFTAPSTTGGLPSKIISASIVPVGNSASGWFRCSITGCLGSNATSLYPNVSTAQFGRSTGSMWRGAQIYSGTGTSFYMWGAQFELREYATKYTPVTTSASITNYNSKVATTTGPRIEFDPITFESKGLLLEDQRTNLIRNSSNIVLNTTDWSQLGYSPTALSVLNNVTIAPDGTNSATLLNFSAIGNEACLASAAYTTISSGTVQTSASVFVKAVDTQYIYLFCQSSGSYNWRYGAKFNLSNQTYTNDGATSAGINAVGNGWYRIWISGTVPNTNTARWSICTSSSGSNHAVGSVIIWGPQLETGYYNPAEYPTNYIKTDFSFKARGTSNTYRSKYGTIGYSSLNEARYDYNEHGGKTLLIEGAATNQNVYTEFVTSNSSIDLPVASYTANNCEQAPDGSWTASKLVPDTTSNSHYIRKISTWAGTGYITSSVYVKSAGFQYCVLRVDNIPSDVAYFDLINGTIVSSDVNVVAKMINCGGGWYRISVTTNWPTVSNSNCGFELYSTSLSNSTIFSGDGVSGLYFWGCQTELQSSYATSYIPSIQTWNSRSSSATYIDGTGTVRYATANTARYSSNPNFQYGDAKLYCESQSTNLLLNSNATVGWVNATVTPNAAVSPDGTTTASYVYATAASSGTTVTYATGSGGTNYNVTGPYTGSVWLKYAGSQYVRLSSNSGTIIPFNLTIDLINGTIIAGVGTIQAFPNGWYRVSASAYSTATGNQVFYVILGNSSGSNNYTVSANQGICYVWGWQVEQGVGASSYIPTAGSAVTRVSDGFQSAQNSRLADRFTSAGATRSKEYVYSGDNAVNWFNSSEGTLFLNIESVNRGTGRTYLYAEISNFTDYYLIQLAGTGREIVGSATTSGISQALAYNQAKTTYPFTVKTALGYAQNNFALYNKGVQLGTDTSFTTPSNLSILKIGDMSTNPNYPCGQMWVKKFSYYPIRLTNTELQSLSTS